MSIFGVEDGDLITARSLAATKLTGWLVPVGTGIAAVYGPLTDEAGPFENLTPGQRLTLWIAVLAAILVMVTVDAFVRAWVTSAASKARVTLFPRPLGASFVEDGNEVVQCTVVGCRSFGADGRSTSGEFLVMPQGGADATAKWVVAGHVTF